MVLFMSSKIYSWDNSTAFINPFKNWWHIKNLGNGILFQCESLENEKTGYISGEFVRIDIRRNHIENVYVDDLNLYKDLTGRRIFKLGGGPVDKLHKLII